MNESAKPPSSLVAKLSSVPQAFVFIAKKINEIIDRNQPLKAGTGITITESETSRLISLDSSTYGSVTERFKFYHPFKVVQTSANSTTCAIIGESRLYSSLSSSSSYTISSLTTSITLTATTVIWLKVSVTSLAPTAATITTTSPSDFVTTSGSPAAQTEFHVCIGKVTSGTNADAPGFDFTISGNAYHFEQTLFNHLLIENRARSGVAIIYAFPFSGA